MNKQLKPLLLETAKAMYRFHMRSKSVPRKYFSKLTPKVCDKSPNCV